MKRCERCGDLETMLLKLVLHAKRTGLKGSLWDLARKFVFSSELGFNWEKIRASLECLPWETEAPGLMVKKTSIGPVTGLVPSKKYYLGWPDKSVQLCHNCSTTAAVPCGPTYPCTGSTGNPLSGSGHCDGCRDAAWKNQLEREAGRSGVYIESGGENPVELFACQAKEVSYCFLCKTNYPDPEWNVCEECNVPLSQSEIAWSSP